MPDVQGWAGRECAAAVVDGIEARAIFVLLPSRQADESPLVRRGLERAVGTNRPVRPVGLAGVLPCRSLAAFASSAHLIHAWRVPEEQHWQRLADVIRAARGASPPAASAGS